MLSFCLYFIPSLFIAKACSLHAGAMWISICKTSEPQPGCSKNAKLFRKQFIGKICIGIRMPAAAVGNRYADIDVARLYR